MKKTLSSLFVLFLILAVFAACRGDEPALSSSPGDVSPMGSEPRTEPLPDHATVEYGEPDLIADNIGPLWAYVRYPQAGDATDYLIARWADEMYQDAFDEIQALRETDASAEGEINIQFNSYLVDDRYASVLERGVFIASGMERPRHIVRAFNIDTKSGLMLDNANILDPAKQARALALLREKILEAYPGADRVVDGLDDMDDSWLTHIAIGHEGIIVLPAPDADRPPGYEELTVTLPYDELGSAFWLGEEQTTTATSVLSVSAAAPFVPLWDDVDPTLPMVALTFDDGPSQHTDQILDLLETHGGRATFFVIGNLVERRQDTVRRAFDMGCEILGHSWDHRNLTKLTRQEIETGILDTRDVIESITGPGPQLYRPPYGAVSETLKEVSRDLGFALVLWSVDPRDWQTRNADLIVPAIMNNAKDRAIILSHDLYGPTADAMTRVIPELRARGYQLVTVSELLYYADIDPEAGHVYYKGN